VSGNREIVEGILGAFNDRDYDAFDRFVAEDVVIHNAGGQGLEGMKADIRDFIASFPDAYSELEDLVDMGDKVVIRDVCKGTNTGEFFGGPPTGRYVEILEITAYRIEGGKVAEAWYFHDEGSLMRQMGLAPAEAPAV
jgi:steroid delta-isomerase-like uncharacterized protein